MKGSKNVRKVQSGKKADTQLIANIRAKGILQNLVVEPSLARNGFYEVIAGGRRWSAVGMLVKAGDFAEAYSVPCKIQRDGRDYRGYRSRVEKHTCTQKKLIHKFNYCEQEKADKCENPNL